MNERTVNQSDTLIVLGLQIYASEDYTCPEQQQKRQEYKNGNNSYILVILNTNVITPKAANRINSIYKTLLINWTELK